MAEPFRRPLLIIFHCGIFFAVFVIFLFSIGRRDVDATYTLELGPGYIRNMLILLSTTFVGYLGLWFLTRWALPLLLVCGVALVGYGFHIHSISLVNFLPLLTVLTTLPLWPMMGAKQP